MDRKRAGAVFAAFFCIFLIAALCTAHINGLNEAEIKIIAHIQHALSIIPNKIPEAITNLPYGKTRNIVLILLIVSLLMAKNIKGAIIAFAALPVCQTIYEILKELISRERPPIDMRLTYVENFSFPSGHSLMSIVLYGLCIYFICKYVKNKILKSVISGIFCILILTIGFTRIWLGVHYPTDIIGGYSLGICFLCLFWLIYNFEFKDLSRIKKKIESVLAHKFKN